MKILVVEDQDAIRNMIEALVTARGYEVIAVSTGAKALDVAATEAPDIVLLDLNLPGLYDGFDVCRRLHDDPSTRHIPVVVITAIDDEETRARVLKLGAKAYHNKPFSPTKLLTDLERWGGPLRK